MDTGIATTRILLVEDNPGDVRLVREQFSEAGPPAFEIDHVGRLEEALQRLEADRFDVVLLDLSLPDAQGLDSLTRMQAAAPTVPVVVLTGRDDEHLSLQAVHAGAQDYLIKGQGDGDTLSRSIRYAIERKGLTKDLLQANQQLKSKNQKLAQLYDTAHQFVDDVSHEFRTPLTVIKEFASIIADGLAGETTEKQREYLQIILNRADDLGHMVNDMLDISKLEADLLSVFRAEHAVADIVENVRTMLERKAAATGVEFRIALDDGLPTVYCDAEKIGRVIVNLVVNACKFSGDDGKVVLTARHDPEQSQITFGVTDNGPGIAPENLQAIFDRFKQVGGNVRASTKGFGLGLNIVKELVMLNLGDVAVESAPGRGSTFAFTVPVHDPPAIVGRLVKRPEFLRNDWCHMSLSAVRVDPSNDPDLIGEVEEFLHHHIRRGDLIFRAGPGAWLLCTAATPRELGDHVARITDAHAEANRNRPGDKLPDIRIDVKGTWRIAGEWDSFVRCFAAEYTPDAPAALDDGGPAEGAA